MTFLDGTVKQQLTLRHVWQNLLEPVVLCSLPCRAGFEPIPALFLDIPGRVHKQGCRLTPSDLSQSFG